MLTEKDMKEGMEMAKAMMAMSPEDRMIIKASIDALRQRQLFETLKGSADGKDESGKKLAV